MLAIGILSRPPQETLAPPKVAMVAEPPGKIGEPVVTESGSAGDGARAGMLKFCPRCSSPGLVRIEGCDTCLNCGHSRCG